MAKWDKDVYAKRPPMEINIIRQLLEGSVGSGGAITIINSDSYLNIARGLVPGADHINKFGHNPSLDSSGQQTIWEQGGLYTYLTVGTTLYVSSTDNADTHEITAEGLDANYVPQTQSVNLTGQAQAAIPGTWLRLYRAYNSDSTVFAGTVYIAETDTLTNGTPDTASKIKAKLIAENQQTEQALYTVAAGKTGYLTGGFITTDKNKDIEAFLYIRQFGGIFRLAQRVNLFQNVFVNLWQPPIAVPARSDVEIRAIGTTGGQSASVSAGFDLILYDN